MRVHITARHIELTGALTNYLTKKVNHLERHFDHLVWANAIMWVEKHRHVAEVVIHSPLHTIRAEAEAGDLYAAIDLVADKMERQLKKIKEKNLTEARERGRSRVEHRMDAYYSLAAEELGPAKAGSGFPQTVSVVKKVPVKPMTVDEAIGAMDQLGYVFWMFFNKSTNNFNVLFRRSDQTYGLLEPASKSVMRSKV